ncbi:MAG TPA: hypothetical protein VK154_08245, partial [Chitinophagales bacterium]|nr:hypothetical protein [Chitinophagales bacterium]
MPKLSLTRWFRNISIARKLYFATGIMAVLIAFELVTLWFAVSTLSSVRAFVGGEGLWSKAQKDAVFHLYKYGTGRDEKDFIQYQEFMKVPLGDHKTRMELIKAQPDMAIARQGFIEGRNHPDDVDGMIKLFTRFHNIYYIKKAIYYWTAADNEIEPLVGIANELHREVTAPSPSQERIDQLLKEIDALNEKVT